MEKILDWPEKILEFHTWYLKEKGWIQRTDSGGYAITVVGIDVLEESGLMTGKDLLLPEPKPGTKRKEGRKEIDKAGARSKQLEDLKN